MIEERFTIEPATWAGDADALRAVRTEVFIVEQAIPEDEEWDEHDARSHHVIARDPQGRPIGTGRLTPLHTIGRMAVVRAWRGKGVGEAVLRSLVERAREMRLPAVELHAQTHAIPFYAREGFVAFGDEYDECGIPHRSMRLDLAPSVRPPEAAPPTSPDAQAWLATNRDEARAAVLGVLAGARRAVSVLTRDLDPALLDDPDVIEAFKRLALAGGETRIRLLVQEPARAAGEGHRLVALAQRLSSTFAFRTPVEEIDRLVAGAFIVNDRGGCFERGLATRFEGEGSSHAPARAAQLLAQFDAIWERSEPAAALRRLEL